MKKLPKDSVVITELNEDKEFEFRYRDGNEMVMRKYGSEEDEDGKRYHSVEFKSCLSRIAIVVYLRGYWGTSEGSKNFKNTFYCTNGHKITIKVIDASAEGK